MAFFNENGPFVIPDGKHQIENNPYSWNLKANMVWMESPAGVGFSIAENPEDLQTNDMRSSEDNLKAILQWFEKFPEF